jgi:hypothetical protein
MKDAVDRRPPKIKIVEVDILRHEHLHVIGCLEEASPVVEVAGPPPDALDAGNGAEDLQREDPGT